MKTGKENRIVLDFSKFADYLFQQGPTGIARIDLAYAEHLVANPHLFAAGLHERAYIRTRFSHRTLRRLVRLVHRQWDQGDRHGVDDEARAWLEGALPDLRRAMVKRHGRLEFGKRLALLSVQWPYHNGLVRIPPGAIYLNTSYARLDQPAAFRWLSRRPDVMPVFMVHDLIPLDNPEYFWPMARQKFLERLLLLLRYAQLIIVPSEVVAQRLRRLAREHGHERITIVPIATPPAAEFLEPAEKPMTSRHEPPYFVVCATIEPRKNHRLLLDIWADMARNGGTIPKLLVVGGRGWNNDAVFERLERQPELKGHVLEVSNLSTRDLRDLIARSNGLLLPSFDEGYGMPLVEALAVGAPVIASDIPVFREVTRGHATLLPLDAPGLWAETIGKLAFDRESLKSAREQASAFDAPRWDCYFEQVLAAIAERRRAEGRP